MSYSDPSAKLFLKSTSDYLFLTCDSAAARE